MEHIVEKKTLFLCRTAVCTAVICGATMVIQIPIPLGYAHLGDSCILLVSLLFGWKTGAVAAGMGSALADILTGYPQWAVFTLVIKGIQGGMAGKLCHGRKTMSGMTAVGVSAAILEMAAGYAAGGAILSGSLAAGIASLPGLLLKGLLNLVIFYAAALILEKSGVYKTGAKTHENDA